MMINQNKQPVDLDAQLAGTQSEREISGKIAKGGYLGQIVRGKCLCCSVKRKCFASNLCGNVIVRKHVRGNVRNDCPGNVLGMLGGERPWRMFRSLCYHILFWCTGYP